MHQHTYERMWARHAKAEARADEALDM